MNLLTDPLFRVDTKEGLQKISLPELLEALGQDTVRHFSGIQRHQEDAFHVFLCQLGAVVLARQGHDNPKQSKAYWQSGLHDLAGVAGDDAWSLVVDDLSKPAFMQPPLNLEKSRLNPKIMAPDALDILNTAKNHDIKCAKNVNAHPDEWIYALINLQTMSGFFGRGNYGIARMNSGFGNRPIVELTQSFLPGKRWQDAVKRLFIHRQTVLSEAFGYDPRGLVLVWLEPWDGQTSLSLSRLDPFFIEICRRVRLQCLNNMIHAATLPSENRRIDAEQLKGIVGDAWLPIDGEKALTISAHGLTPDVMRRLVFEDGLKLTALQKPLDYWQENLLWLIVSVLVRGQGKTEGFHERHIMIPKPAQKRIFGPPAFRDPLAILAKTAIEHAGKMQNKVLKPAVFSYLQTGKEIKDLKFDRDAANAWWDRFARQFDAAWSDLYFPWLWEVPDPFENQTEEKNWAVKLQNTALEILREAEQALPVHNGLKYRLKTQADRIFWFRLKDVFPILNKEQIHEHHSTTAIPTDDG